jgi:hypothetical protein
VRAIVKVRPTDLLLDSLRGIPILNRIISTDHDVKPRSPPGDRFRLGDDRTPPDTTGDTRCFVDR